MQRLYGVPLTDLDSISSLVSNSETSFITALNEWFGSLLACEFFHADVHAVWIIRDGHIESLNFEIVGRIPEIKFPGGRVYHRRYTKFYGTEGDAVAHIAHDAIIVVHGQVKKVLQDCGNNTR